VAELTFYDHRATAAPPGRRWTTSTTPPGWRTPDALRERLGHEQVVLLGHSYGGFLALRYALAHPERVRALVLVSTAATMQHWERVHENLAARQATPAQLRAFEDRPFTDDTDMAETLQALLPLYFHRPDPALMATLGQGLQVSAEACTAGGRCMADYDVRADLVRIDVPTLVLAGRHDFILPPDVTAEPLAAGVPGAELVVFEDSGHFPFVEENDAFLRVVRRFLGSLS
jgi:proline iminopeptidase